MTKSTDRSFHVRAALLAASLTLLSPPVALAGGISRARIDGTLLRLDRAELADVEAAEGRLAEAEALNAEIEHDAAIGAAEQRAAEAWVSAGDSALDALDAEIKAAELARRDEEMVALGVRRVRAEAARTWRKALIDQAQARLRYEAARARWNRAVVKTLSTRLELERMRAYSARSGRAPDKDIQTGRILTRMGRQGNAQERQAGKLAQARVEWERAIQAAASLEPRNDGGRAASSR